MNTLLRQKIVDAAEVMILRKGLKATMDEIAAEAGMTKGGLFYYFSGKDELVLSVLSRFEDRLEEERRIILRALPPSPFSYFRATIIAMLDHFRRTRNAMPQIGGLFDVPAYREAIAGIKARIFRSLCSSYPYPNRVAAAVTFIDGMWWNSIFDSPVYYEAYWQDMRERLMRYVDSLEARHQMSS